MNQDQYCRLKEHQRGTSVCVMENCGYQSRLVCKDSRQFHSHDQETDSHLLDLEIILRNQEALKDQSYQYHTKISKIYELQQQIKAFRSQLDELDNTLKKQIQYYDKYIENLYCIQINLYSKEFEKQVDFRLAQIINKVNNFEQDNNKNKMLNIVNKIQMNLSKLNESIHQLYKTQDNKQLQLVSHKQQIQFAQISPNNQDLLIGFNQKLYSYSLQQQNYQQICNISIDTQSFVISKDYQQFYFENDSALKIYNRNLNKWQQIILQNNMDSIMVLSKVLAVTYFSTISKLQIINLKSKKIIFAFEEIDDIVDMHYIQNKNLLIVAQPFVVDVIILNPKARQHRLENNDSRILNIQFNQAKQQLIILENKGILNFWTLDKNDKFVKNVNQIKIKQSQIRYFRYNSNLQLYIVFSASEIIFYSIQGQILQSLNHGYKDIMCFNSYLNYCNEPIIFRTDGNYHLIYQDSISLLRLSQK